MLDIAITGAGPVGLTLARLLLPYTSHSTSTPTISITVFEKDTSPTSRLSVGGTLDLHPKTGLAAIQACNLWDEFSKHARFEGEEIQFCDRNGFCYIHQIEIPKTLQADHARPEIDRVRLMEVLLGSTPEGIIQWGKQVKEVKRAESDDKWSLVLGDGSVTKPFDLVVGADGAWSKVRKALTDVEPSFSGICSVSGTIDQDSAGASWEHISNMVGKGSNFAFSYGKSMVGQRMGDGSLKIGFDQKREPAWLQSLDEKYKSDDDALKRALLEEYKDWVPEFQRWIIASKQLWTSSLYELPVGHRYEHQKGIVLIGDSAHLATPFAGEGVNAGMRDALDLAAAIESSIKENQDLDRLIADFEESMFVRTKVVMQDTMMNKDGMFAHDAPYSLLANFVGVAAREFGYDLDKGWISWVPLRSAARGVFWTMGSYGAVSRRVKDALIGQKPL
ncbi:hypothetical protein LTR64_004778 [Lithohypha guttulata]|uniref:uncharacterized protein n=1 Tax=Lithohypha guttulata TaxID=1690604 RepID=UPI002DE1BBE2|nr:hypothetical protein LTR51_005925 [Lithohypha guttulata]